MENLTSADMDYNLWLLFLKLRLGMFKVRNRELSRYGITPEQAGVLHLVHTFGNETTPSEISRLMLREPNTVSALVDRMEKKGLVRKVRDLGRKNLIRITMTEKGKEAYRQSMKRETIHEIMSALSEEQRQQLWSCLTILLEKTLKELQRPRPGLSAMPPSL